MKWTWIYIALGGTFIVKLIESSRTIALINEAQQLKQVTKKPIMLISNNPRQGFDVYLNPNETIAWQLPYTNKAFASIVSDSLEDIPYPKQAMAEWMRVADTVLVNTHSIFSPEAWLDLRHQQVFMGQQTILVNPATNWAIAGGVGYFFYRRRKRTEVERKEEEAEALPTPEEEEEELLPESTATPTRKALPPPKVEPAPIYHPSGGLGGVKISPEELSGVHLIEEGRRKPFQLPTEEVGRRKSKGRSNSEFRIPNSEFPKGSVNLGIGNNQTLSTELKAKGIENLVFDPLNLPEEHNKQILSRLEGKPADSATLFSVLDKVSDPEERKGALQVAYENIKPGGKVFIKVEEPKKYLTEVKRVFPGAKIRKDMILAVK